MLSCIYSKEGKIELKDNPKPTAKKDTFIMKVSACSICGTDLRTYINGSKKILPNLIMGHEASGVISEIGEDVKGFKVGDRVAIAPAIGCGECVPCKKGHTNMCNNLKTLGYQYEGIFSEYVEVPYQAIKMGNVNKIPDNVSDEAACLAEPIACALNAQEFLNIKNGDIVVIYGSGFIGCMHAELAFNQGADKVVMIDISEERLNEAKKFVKDIITFNSMKVSIPEEIQKLTNNNGADVVITACSVGPVQKQAAEIAGKLGRISLFGGLPGDSTTFIDGNMIHYKELSVHGVHASSPKQNKEILAQIAKGNLEPKKYISQIFDLRDIIEAFEGLKSHKLLKAIIKP